MLAAYNDWNILIFGFMEKPYCTNRYLWSQQFPTLISIHRSRQLPLYNCPYEDSSRRFISKKKNNHSKKLMALWSPPKQPTFGWPMYKGKICHVLYAWGLSYGWEEGVMHVRQRTHVGCTDVLFLLMYRYTIHIISVLYQIHLRYIPNH